jgi:hypothetical protein
MDRCRLVSPVSTEVSPGHAARCLLLEPAGV